MTNDIAKALAKKAFEKSNEKGEEKEKEDYSEFEKELLRKATIFRSISGGEQRGLDLKLDLGDLVKSQTSTIDRWIDRVEALSQRTITAERKAELEAIKGELASLKDEIRKLASPPPEPQDPFKVYEKMSDIIDKTMESIERRFKLTGIGAKPETPELIEKYIQLKEKEIERDEKKYEHERRMAEEQRRWLEWREEQRRQWAKEDARERHRMMLEQLKWREELEMKRRALEGFEDIAESVVAMVSEERGIGAKEPEKAEIVDEEAEEKEPKEEKKPEEKGSQTIMRECHYCGRKAITSPDAQYCPFCGGYYY